MRKWTLFIYLHGWMIVMNNKAKIELPPIDPPKLKNIFQGEFLEAQMKKAGLSTQGLANLTSKLTSPHINGLLNEIYFITPYVAHILSKIFTDITAEYWMQLDHKDKTKTRPVMAILERT